jgi:hypothetical protein
MHLFSICFDNCTAFVEVYKRNYFPFIQQGWSKKPKGFWYSSIVEEGAGIQLDINATSLKIQDCHRLCAVPRVWVNEASLLPTAPGVNPQATVMAIAIRNARHFIDAQRPGRG